MTKRVVKKLLWVFTPAVLSLYHYYLAYIGAFIYGFPSRELTVIGVTGTDGKSSTTEYINAIFEAAGYKTAMSNSIRVKIGSRSLPSTGRSMPGRFFIQRLLREALNAGCTVAVVEMTSEGVKQHRHRAIALNCLVFLNLSPEHVESHGSYEAYADAKFELARGLLRSRKRPRVIVANADDAQGARYLALPVEKKCAFSLTKQTPWKADERGGTFTFEGVEIAVHVGGQFYIKNALAAAEVARAFGIEIGAIRKGIGSITKIPGRMERIEAGQNFSVIVDYALTPEALEALYKTFGDSKKICIFGSAGGGRDTWKRPVLGKLAETYCDTVILTNDIAYGEDPQSIIHGIAAGMRTPPQIIPDRRAAIQRGLEIAQQRSETDDVVVLITGMGIDTEITAADGSTVPWSDAGAAREELAKLARA